ncbi:dihydrolipoamide succinyltransferase, partial [Xylella fastidiosa subsp. multiplex]|nr:dihydrolipoamide succinyltransferase [Xylella fastidiosa subsp. multiplex]
PAQPGRGPAPAPASTPAERPLAPSVQRIVTENNLDASTIQGTGKDGRITKGDALQASEAPRAPAAAAAPPAAPAAPRAPGER